MSDYGPHFRHAKACEWYSKHNEKKKIESSLGRIRRVLSIRGGSCFVYGAYGSPPAILLLHALTRRIAFGCTEIVNTLWQPRQIPASVRVGLPVHNIGILLYLLNHGPVKPISPGTWQCAKKSLNLRTGIGIEGSHINLLESASWILVDCLGHLVVVVLGRFQHCVQTNCRLCTEDKYRKLFNALVTVI